MKHKIWAQLQKVLIGFSLSAGVLAIVNSETIWQEYHRDDRQEINRFLVRRLEDGKPRVRVVAAYNDEASTAGAHAVKPLQSALSRSLEDDELLDSNPFAHLSTLDPMQKLMQKGVATFHRETFRSPDYKDESGYDLLSYAIDHNDGSKSTIMAYSENKVVFVVFMVGNSDGATYSYFKGGELVEQSELTSGEADRIVSRRISQGIPFLSVSR